MNLFRKTAMSVVVLIALACNNKSKMEVLNLDPVTAGQKEIDIAEYKPAEKYKMEDEGLQADSDGKQQIQGEKQKQPGKQQTIPQTKQDWDKKIIKTAVLNLEVKDYEIFSATLREKIKSLGSYIAQEEQTQSEYKIENSITVKVPVEQFDIAVMQLADQAEKINEKKITSQDVTTEVIDTKSRMESKKQVRLRYIDLLKQAKSMEEILNVQSEINNIQEEIESAAGRVEYLSHSSAFSTIHVTYYQVLNTSAKDPTDPSFGTKLSNSFKTGWSWIGDILIGLVSIWPLFLMIFAGIIFYKRTKQQKPKQA